MLHTNRLPSQSPATSTLPALSNLIDLPSTVPFTSATDFPVFASHRRIAPVVLCSAINLPFGDHATDDVCGGSSHRANSFPLARSQIFPPVAVTTRLPSGENAT